MATLTHAGNVNNTILTILEEKGYQVWSERANEYWAEKNGWDFCAASTVELLGLIAVYEHVNPMAYKEYWWKTEGHLTMDNIPREKRDYLAVYMRDRKCI